MADVSAAGEALFVAGGFVDDCGVVFGEEGFGVEHGVDHEVCAEDGGVVAV